MPVHLVLVLHEQLALAEVRVLEDVLGRVDRRAHDAALVDDLVELVRRVPGGERADDLVEQVLVLAARVVGGEALVLPQLGLAHDRPPAAATACRGWPRSRPTCRRCERYTFEGAIRGSRGPVGSRTKPVFSYSSVEDSLIAKHASTIAGVDDLALGAALARVQREQDALERRLGGERVAEGDAGARRRLVRVAVDVAQAGDRLAGGREPGPVARSGRSGRSRRRGRRSRAGCGRARPRARGPTSPSCPGGSSRARCRRSRPGRRRSSGPPARAG